MEQYDLIVLGGGPAVESGQGDHVIVFGRIGQRNGAAAAAVVRHAEIADAGGRGAKDFRF